MPNFKKLAKGYHDNAVIALQEILKKQSTYDPKTIGQDAPYGKGVKSALDYLADLGDTYGFNIDKCNGYCTEISYGEEGPVIGIYAHSDVVPAVGEWRHPPFLPTFEGEGKNKKIIARGSSDDKGPLIAAFYAIKLLKDNGLIKGYRVRLVSGGDEERGSSCLKYYFETLHKPASDYGFTPDADFPLIYAEKGMVAGCHLVGNVDLSPIVAMEGGSVSNAICSSLVVSVPADPNLEKAFNEAHIDGFINHAGPIDLITFNGKSAHGSTPEKGVNAALIAFAFLGDYYHNAFLINLYKTLSDPNGREFNGCVSSKELGLTTYNFGVIKYTSDHKLSISVDFRYGEEVNPESCLKALEAKSGLKVEYKELVKPLLYSKESPLVKTLMKSYKHMTHRHDKPMAIGGGTYAKEAPNCVAYGSAFAEHPGDIHSPNEYIYLEDFYAQIAIYADAIYSLGHIK